MLRPSKAKRYYFCGHPVVHGTWYKGYILTATKTKYIIERIIVTRSKGFEEDPVLEEIIVSTGELHKDNQEEQQTNVG